MSCSSNFNTIGKGKPEDIMEIEDCNYNSCDCPPICSAQGSPLYSVTHSEPTLPLQSMPPLIEKQKNEEGVYPMSLCLAVDTKDAIYSAADSRSSVGFGDKTIAGYCLNHFTVDDNYQKIACIKILNTDVVLFSTGNNRFNEKDTFVDCLSKIPLSDVQTVEEGIRKIGAYFTERTNSATYICFFYFINHNRYFYCDYASQRENPFCFTNNELLQGKSSINYVFSGVNWGQDLAKHMFFRYDFDDTRAVCAINQLYEKVQLVSPYFDNTIGGTIRIAKLTPDGFTWLQGKPESEQ